MPSHPAHSELLPLQLSGTADPILQQALEAYRSRAGASAELLIEKAQLLEYYDPPGIENAIALVHWGRSGSILLASYLDGHEDAIVLPNLTGELIYPFCESYAALSVWDKLIAYPIYSAVRKGGAADLFLANNPAGDYATSADHYYAAVTALYARYYDQPQQWLQLRARFIQFLHVAYAVANEQQPREPHPVILYAQHFFNQDLAERFANDFPQGRFLHTVRDPITALNSWFDMRLGWQFGAASASAKEYSFPAFDAMRDLLRWDRPHSGMQQRSWALRFEDMHLALQMTMYGIAEWLGIAYQTSLLESTLNRRPYIVTKGGRSWRGPNHASAERRSNFLHRCDRALIFALFYDKFIDWGYAVPRVFRFGWVRLLTTFICALVPMKIELINARILLAKQAVPALRSGRLLFACAAPLHLLLRRLRMMGLLFAEGCRRISHRPTPLPLLQGTLEATAAREARSPPAAAADLRPAPPRPV